MGEKVPLVGMFKRYVKLGRAWRSEPFGFDMIVVVRCSQIFCFSPGLVSFTLRFLLWQHHPHHTLPYPHQVPEAYQPPPWTRDFLTNPPLNGRLRLANLPTPIYPLNCNPISLLHCSDSSLLAAAEAATSNISWYIKRDDCTSGVELGGNKIRKLEFLLADALAHQCTAVVTIGGVQSNHCRATAAAARMVGLEPHLILRTSVNSSTGTESRRNGDTASTTGPSSQGRTGKTGSTSGGETDSETGITSPKIPTSTLDSAKDPLGWTGNLLVERMVGSFLYTCTPGEYARFGSVELVKRLCAHLEQASTSSGSSSRQCRVYPIPVGGSNGLGSWGYIEAVAELLEQWPTATRTGRTGTVATNAELQSPPVLNHIVVACGSGGTAAGIAVGLALAFHHIGRSHISPTDTRTQSEAKDAPPPPPTLHAIGVCDDPDYFYRTVASIADEMGLVVPRSAGAEDKSSNRPTGITEAEEFIRRHLVVHQGKGLGYASSSPEELAFVRQFARHTGVVLDPVYTGKALYAFTKYVTKHPQRFHGTQNVLFWHTGGALGMYDKGPELEPHLTIESPCQRLNLYGPGVSERDGVDVSLPASS